MRSEDLDPAYRSALRETMVILVFYAAALTYTVAYCYTFGYGRDPAGIVTYAGVPGWVLWGIFVPWAVCMLATVWFCFWYMADEDLEPPAVHGAGESPEEPSNAG